MCPFLLPAFHNRHQNPKFAERSRSSKVPLPVSDFDLLNILNNVLSQNSLFSYRKIHSEPRGSIARIIYSKSPISLRFQVGKIEAARRAIARGRNEARRGKFPFPVLLRKLLVFLSQKREFE